MSFGVIRKIIKEKQELTNVDVNGEEVPIPAHPGPKVEPPPPIAELMFDIDIKDPETIKAATLIQAGFRSLGTRREISQMHKAASRIQAGFRSKQTRVILNTMKTALATDYTDSESEDDLQDDWIESSVSASEKSANAPIRNKKVPFGLIRKILKDKQDSDTSVGSSDDDDTIKENMTDEQDEIKQKDVQFDLHNDASGADGVDKPHTKSEKPEDIDTEFLEEDLQDDWTESSVSVSEKSANAPIRNKKVTPFKALGLIGMMFGIKKMELTLSSSGSGSDYTDSESEDALQNDWIESSVSVSEKSANAPIRNKKVPFGVIRIILKNNQDSVTSVGGSDDEDTIKENMTEKQDKLDFHNDLAPGAGTNGVAKSHAESEEPENSDAEFLEEDLQDDWTESSASVSEKSANASIRNKKVPFGLIRKILKDNQISVTSVRGIDDLDTIKENMTEKQDELDLHNDPAPGAVTNGVDKSLAESEEPENIDTEFLEEDLQDDCTESSVSVSKKSANAPTPTKINTF